MLPLNGVWIIEACFNANIGNGYVLTTHVQMPIYGCSYKEYGLGLRLLLMLGSGLG